MGCVVVNIGREVFRQNAGFPARTFIKSFSKNQKNASKMLKYLDKNTAGDSFSDN